MLIMRVLLKKNAGRVLAIVLCVWVLLHIPGILYGTENLPFHENYVSTDEQPSVNSALRMLNEKSILAFRNQERQYYGPLMVIVDTPGVVLDFAVKYVTGVARSAEEYKSVFIWDWGGILRNIRVTALLSMAIGLLFVYQILSTTSVNPSRSPWLPIVGTVLLGFNYYYFQYSHFAFHWAYILPLLLAQLYTFVRIYETDGSVRKYWWWHGFTVVASFGISYIGVIFLVFWVPWLYTQIKTKNVEILRKFLCLVGGTLLGWIAIVAWHPFAFIRYASFWGIGDPIHNNADLLNPFVFAAGAFEYYSKLLLFNHFALLAFIALLLYVLRKEKPWQSIVFLALSLPGFINYILFSLMSLQVGRYALPTIVSIVLVTTYLLAQYINKKKYQRRTINIIIVTLLVWQAAFHLLHVGLLLGVFSDVPVRQQAIQTALDLQKNGDTPILIIDTTILGHPHTTESYKAYAKSKGFGDIPLYREMYRMGPPGDMELLNARYFSLRDLEQNPMILEDFSAAMQYFHSRRGEWSPFDYYDENILRNWYRKDTSDYFVVIK